MKAKTSNKIPRGQGLAPKPKRMPKSIRTKVAVKQPTGSQKQSAFHSNG